MNKKNEAGQTTMRLAAYHRDKKNREYTANLDLQIQRAEAAAALAAMAEPTREQLREAEILFKKLFRNI